MKKLLILPLGLVTGSAFLVAAVADTWFPKVRLQDNWTEKTMVRAQKVLAWLK